MSGSNLRPHCDCSNKPVGAQPEEGCDVWVLTETGELVNLNESLKRNVKVFVVQAVRSEAGEAS